MLPYKVPIAIQSAIDLAQLAQENTGYPNLGFLGPANLFGMEYQTICMDEIPNFLDVNWADK